MAGVDDGEEPPVPIPNTEVKLTCAEDSCWKRPVKIGRCRLLLKSKQPTGRAESPVRGFALLSTISSVGRATDS